MIKLIIAVTLVVTGCFFGSIIDFSEQDIKGKENVIFNSSFEEGEFAADPIPLGWIILNDMQSCVSSDLENFNSVQRSLLISHPHKKINLVSESFPLDPDGIYFSRCFLKTNYQSNQAVEILFVAFDSKGKQVNKYKTKAYPQENWTKVVMTASFFKPNARFGRIIISFPARPDKVFWLDDVESYNMYNIQK
ncbi:MAG: hypothetical protein Q7J16_13540 [Candidatus Cloacimonadales bacterium]|nr:hypothetical protein [Candidatus Cloacimonadales bacterium]